MADKICDKMKARGGSWTLLPDAFFHILLVYNEIKTGDSAQPFPVFIF